MSASAADAAPTPWKSRYGTPLSGGTDACYAFWPSKAGMWPILFFCSEEVLAADTDATVGNERSHNPGQRIANKLRSSLKPRTIEQLTLAAVHLRKMATAKLKTYANILAASEVLDLEEMQEAWAQAGAAAASASAADGAGGASAASAAGGAGGGGALEYDDDDDE